MNEKRYSGKLEKLRSPERIRIMEVDRVVQLSIFNPDVQSVLDVGCGTGLMFSHVANQAEAVVGVDISRKQLLKAREQAKSFSNVHLVHADADHLPVKGDYFMMVFAFTVLQNMPSPPETLRELKRAGKRGGSIVVSGLKKTFSLEVFGALLQKTGLRVVFCEDNKRLKCYVAVGTQD